MTLANILNWKWLQWAGLGVLIVIVIAWNSNIDRFKLPASESSAVGNLRNIVSSQNKFRSIHGCFASEMGQLPKVISSDDAYTYSVLPEVKNEKGCVKKYLVVASPGSEAKGLRYFSLDENETLRFETTHQPGPNSPILR